MPLPYEQWLTLAQLVPAWANELANASSSSSSQIENELWHYLYEDIINGRLDDSGPLCNGRRLGLRVIYASGPTRYVEGRLLFGTMGVPVRLMAGRTLVAKEAVLDFARRRKLPPPSWWSDATNVASQPSQSPDELKPAPTVGTFDRPRGMSEPRRPEELRKASEAMVNETIQYVCDAADAAGRKQPNIRADSGHVRT
jgi:hypothetical protein